jgi:DNA modification methylase
MKTIQILNGDSLEVLKQYPDNYFDAVVTDPPYGLGKEPNAEEMLQAWITSGYLEVKGSGFMGKEWDAFVPQPIFWKEVFRVLKHGGHIVAFFGTRTYDWGVMAMRLAGFEVRDCIQWIYGSGFPKSHNIGKAIDKIQGNKREYLGEDEVKTKKRPEQNEKEWNCYSKTKYDNSITKGHSVGEGWGSALKPANEPIVLARKPLEKGLSIAENVLKNGTGGINIDATRVGVDVDDKNHRHNPSKGNEGENSIFGVGGHSGNLKNEGRFPANLILTHHPECECVGSKKVKSDAHHTHKYNGKKTLYDGSWKDGEDMGNKFADENGEETIESWNCHEDCPIKIMDEQSGVSKSTDGRIGNKSGAYSGLGEVGFSTEFSKGDGGFGDKGGASRFFYVAKASKKERNKGLEVFEEKAYSDLDKIGGEKSNFKTGSGNERNIYNQNFHPTIKPVALMRYLVRMITPPNGIVLDPFNGSGTTGVACKVEGFNYVGIELDAEYCKISEARIEGWKSEIEMPETIEQNEVKKEIVQQETPKNQLNLF